MEDEKLYWEVNILSAYGTIMIKETPFSIMNEQDDDESLWFVPETVGEYLLQSALRRLHEIIEGKTSKECAMDVLNQQ